MEKKEQSQTKKQNHLTTLKENLISSQKVTAEDLYDVQYEWLGVDVSKYGYNKAKNSGYYSSKQLKPEKALFLFEKLDKEDENLAIGIMQGLEVDMNEDKDQTSPPWDFTPQNISYAPYKDVWCRETVLVKDLYELNVLTGNKKTILERFKKQIQSQSFIKIASDRDFYYGDGGECRLAKPLYFAEQLKIKEDEQKQLKDLLNKLGDETQDFHETCPVQDIIDPELLPNYSKKLTDHKEYKMNIKKESYDEDINSNDSYYKKPQTCQNNDYVSLRSEYQWIPTKFKITKSGNVLKFGNVTIMGEIHNLPREQNEELYELIQKVFQKQLPAYKQLNLLQFDENNECILQVVVKAQKYVIPSKQKYSGKWHLEGKTENIVAAGVYYISIDKGFEHDQLQYKPLICYDYGYQYEGMDFLRQWNIDVQEGCSVVFSNTLPHRFDTLTNNTDKTLERLFLNFFIIDPSKPLLDMDYFGLVKKTYGMIQQKVNTNVSNYIMEYLGIESDIKKGKERRKKVRENAHKELSGWGFIHYGNSGDVEFVDSFSANVNRGQYYDSIKKQD